jgi:hypothetical protein
MEYLVTGKSIIFTHSSIPEPESFRYVYNNIEKYNRYFKSSKFKLHPGEVFKEIDRLKKLFLCIGHTHDPFVIINKDSSNPNYFFEEKDFIKSKNSPKTKDT